MNLFGVSQPVPESQKNTDARVNLNTEHVGWAHASRTHVNVLSKYKYKYFSVPVEFNAELPNPT